MEREGVFLSSRGYPEAKRRLPSTRALRDSHLVETGRCHRRENHSGFRVGGV